MPSPTATGRAAEALAADFLAAHGHEILAQNWRNRWCELDLISRNRHGVHIIEVKYRRTTDFGLPAEYVRHDKIGRLNRAAAAWCQAHNYTGSCQIDIISISGPLDQPIIELIENALGF